MRGICVEVGLGVVGRMINYREDWEGKLPSVCDRKVQGEAGCPCRGRDPRIGDNARLLRLSRA